MSKGESKYKKNSSFVQNLLNWNCSEIFDEKLLEKLVIKLPDTYDNIQLWSEKPKPHLLEVCRCEIKEALESENLSTTAYSLVLSGKHIRISLKEIPLEPHGNYLVLFVRGDMKKGQSILCYMKTNGNSFVLQFGNDQLRKLFLEYANIEKEAKAKSDWKLHFLPSVTSAERIWDALSRSSSLPESCLFKEIFTAEKIVRNVKISPVSDEFLKSLNDSQKCAVEEIVCAIQAGESCVLLMKGPPGTGKTATLSSLILTLVRHSDKGVVANIPRTHAAAATNQAIKLLATRSLDKKKQHSPNGKNTRDLLLIGNRERLGDLLGGLEEIYLDTRLDLLITHLSSWINQASILRNLIEKGDGGKSDSKFECLTWLIESGNMTVKNLPASHMCPITRDCFQRRVLDWIAAKFEPMREVAKSSNYEDSSLKKFWTSLLLILRSDYLAIVERQMLTYLSLDEMKKKKCMIAEAVVVFSTVSQGGSTLLKDEVFEVAIIDEASQLVEAETAILLKEGLKCLVLVGDEKQLPPTVKSKLAEKHLYGMSLFEHLIDRGFPLLLLDRQYRMHPEIARFPNTQFYNGLIIDGDNVMSESYTKYWHHVLPPFSVCDVWGEEKASGTSTYNLNEVCAVIKIISKLLAVLSQRYPYSKTDPTFQRVTIGIITPYAAQKELMELQIMRSGLGDDERVEIKCRTVNDFQGQECDIIIYSTVKTKPYGLKFLGDEKRLNVAITRAKYSLMIVGRCQTLNTKKVWKKLIDSCENKIKITRNGKVKLIKKAKGKKANTTNTIQSAPPVQPLVDAIEGLGSSMASMTLKGGDKDKKKNSNLNKSKIAIDGNVMKHLVSGPYGSGTKKMRTKISTQSNDKSNVKIDTKKTKKTKKMKHDDKILHVQLDTGSKN